MNSLHAASNLSFVDRPMCSRSSTGSFQTFISSSCCSGAFYSAAAPPASSCTTAWISGRSAEASMLPALCSYLITTSSLPALAMPKCAALVLTYPKSSTSACTISSSLSMFTSERRTLGVLRCFWNINNSTSGMA